MASQDYKLRIGIIGLSDGNGHPYSWSAICNGYDQEFMKDCPFPAIPNYLSKEKFPENFLTSLCEVTHIWTQDQSISHHISQASRIPFVVENYSEMVGKVDAVFLARDDGEHHYEMALPFLEAGLPVFIDKPLAYSIPEAERIYSKRRYDWQIFSCSSLRFAKELLINPSDLQSIGQVHFVEATVPQSWKKYAVHVIEPIVASFPSRGELKSVHGRRRGDINMVYAEWKNLQAAISAYGKYEVPINITYYGQKGYVSKRFENSFECFKESIVHFCEQVKSKKCLIPEDETREIVTIIEKAL